MYFKYMERGDTELFPGKEFEQEDLLVLLDKQVDRNEHGQLVAKRTWG